MSDAALGFTEFHKDASCTVVLIHGGFSNSTELKRMAALLTEYHILLPDLPAHGRSRKSVPDFSTGLAADMVADIVRQHGKNGIARIFGLSLGAHVGLQILTRHPDVVDRDAILTGYNIWSEVNERIFASLGWFGARIGDMLPLPKEGHDCSIDEDGIKHPRQPWAYWRAVSRVICTEAWPGPWPARTLIIAALNRGSTPVTDRPVSACKLRDIGAKGNAETIAVGNTALAHAWPVINPEIAAETIKAWCDRKPLPHGFFQL